MIRSLIRSSDPVKHCFLAESLIYLLVTLQVTSYKTSRQLTTDLALYLYKRLDPLSPDINLSIFSGLDTYSYKSSLESQSSRFVSEI